MDCAVFYLTDPATTEIYTLSLHDALPISPFQQEHPLVPDSHGRLVLLHDGQALAFMRPNIDRKSTRLNSSHPSISYAVFCLKKKTNNFTKFAIQNPAPSRNVTLFRGGYKR